MICSCNKGQSFDQSVLLQLAENSETRYEFISNPREADLIFVIDVDEPEFFINLRKNKIWLEWPDKCFVICERDHPPLFLHGLLSSAKKSWPFQSRFRGCGYVFHQLFFPNKMPEKLNEIKPLKKDYLYSFIGRPTHRIRHKIIAMPREEDVIIEDASTRYDHFDLEQRGNGDSSRAYYWDIASRSKYALCPRGYGASSIRIFEMMEAGVAPIIISDEWVPPWGPNWKEFAIFVKEKNIKNIYQIVKSYESEFEQRGLLARKAWEDYFSQEKYFDFIVRSIDEIQRGQKISEKYYARMAILILFQLRVINFYTNFIKSLRGFVKKIVRSI